MKVITDLGIKNKARYGIFECPICKIHLKRQWTSGKGTHCCNDCKGVHFRAGHGMVGTKQYKAWANMRHRCTTKNEKTYRSYGAKGITFCDEWSTFEGFWSDMECGYSEGMSLDRIDSEKNYCKENCQWITFSENCSKTNRKRMVEQYELLPKKIYGNRLAVFDSARAAAKVVDGCPSAIGKVCKGLKRSVKGYGWKYVV